MKYGPSEQVGQVQAVEGKSGGALMLRVSDLFSCFSLCPSVFPSPFRVRGWSSPYGTQERQVKGWKAEILAFVFKSLSPKRGGDSGHG